MAVNHPLQALRKLALEHPDVEEGIACAGTAIEKRTVKAHNRAFVFLGLSDLMVKLDESLGDARELAAKSPERYHVGAHGWVTARFDDAAPPALDRLGRWIAESYRIATAGRSATGKAKAAAKTKNKTTARKPGRAPGRR